MAEATKRIAAIRRIQIKKMVREPLSAHQEILKLPTFYRASYSRELLNLIETVWSACR